MNQYIHELAQPAFANFVKAEQACDLAWQNVQDAKTNEGRRIAMENYLDIRNDARRFRSFYHKCDVAVRYETNNKGGV